MNNGNFIGDFQHMIEKLFTIQTKILNEREKENNEKIRRYEGIFYELSASDLEEYFSLEAENIKIVRLGQTINKFIKEVNNV